MPPTQTILVTGGSRGLGAEIARHLARFQANLVLFARGAEALAGVAQECQRLGGQALVVSGDVTRPADCQAALQAALDRFGQLDGLVNNSGVIEPIGPVADSPIAEWQENYAVNVLGPVMLTQLAVPHLRARRGRVINVSSGAAEKVIAGWGAYSSGKAALNKITEILASEEPEIRAAAVKPGVVDTAMQSVIREKGRARMDEHNYQRLSQLYEQKVMNSPEKPALAIACLALALPPEWSGQVLQWDEPRVQQLVDRLLGGGAA